MESDGDVVQNDTNSYFIKIKTLQQIVKKKLLYQNVI